MSTSSPQSTSLLSDAHPSPTALAASGPYAQPNTVANDRGVETRPAAASRIGPFVPAAWRSESVGQAQVQAAAEWMSADAAAAPTPPVAAVAAIAAVELPWIHAFIEPAEATVAEPDAVEALYGDIDAAALGEADVVSAHPADVDVAVAELFAPIEEVNEAPMAELASAPFAFAAQDVQQDAQQETQQDVQAPQDVQAQQDAQQDAQQEVQREAQHDGQREDEREQALDALEAGADMFIENASDAVAAVAAVTAVTAAGDTADTETAAAADAWPLDDAGALMRALAAELPATAPVLALPRHEAGKPYATPLGVPPIATTPPLPMWGEDDMMDIMPVRRSPDESSEWGAASAAAATTAPTMDESTSELAAAAAQLEALARRVRQGDLTLAGYTSDMSDAATLAATLTALLSARP